MFGYCLKENGMLTLLQYKYIKYDWVFRRKMPKHLLFEPRHQLSTDNAHRLRINVTILLLLSTQV